METMSHSQLDVHAGNGRVDTDSPTNRVVATLHGLLPQGSAVALAWDDAVLGQGDCVSPGADGLRGAVRGLLAGAPLADGLRQPLVERWTDGDDGARIVVLAEIDASFSEAQRQAWLGTAHALVAAVLVSLRQGVQIEQLERAKRLQRALFEIADLAGSDLEMPQMLAQFHRILCTLMYADNCYIVECDEHQSSLRFLYFADNLDNFAPHPEQRFVGTALQAQMQMRHQLRMLEQLNKPVAKAIGLERRNAYPKIAGKFQNLSQQIFETRFAVFVPTNINTGNYNFLESVFNGFTHTFQNFGNRP